MARFTAANARENAAKAHAARLQRRTTGNLAASTFPQMPQVGQEEAAGSYENKRLARVRKQLDLVDDAIEAEARLTDDHGKARSPDGQRLNWLCAAQERLAEQERILAGRPLPGSMRPTRGRDERRVSPLTTAMPTLPLQQNPPPAPPPATPGPMAPAAPSTPAPQESPTSAPPPLPVKPSTPAPTVAPTLRPAPSMGPVPIEYALRYGPDRRTPPVSPAPRTPPTPGNVATTTATVPTVSPNPKAPG